MFNHWAETDLVIAANNPYNPFGFDLTTIGPDANLFLLGRRPVEGGPRVYQQEVKTWYANAGLEGVFNVGDRTWSWDANVVRSESKAEQTNTGSYNIKHINQALGDVNACLAIAGCVPLNLFGGPGTITPEMLAWIQPIVHDESENKFTQVAANLTGDLFDMPAGPFSFATGYEYRKYEGSYTPDALTIAGEYNGVPSGPTSGSYDVNEAYVEFNVPLAKDDAFAKAFDVSMAARYSDYSTFGSETTTKFGFRWQVVDQLLLRGSVAEGFRAPSIGELYGTFSRFDATLTDPCSGAGATTPNCVADGVPPTYTQDNPQISVVTAGNRDLQPETSRSFMLGGVLSPAFAEHKAWSRTPRPRRDLLPPRGQERDPGAGCADHPESLRQRPRPGVLRCLHAQQPWRDRQLQRHPRQPRHDQDRWLGRRPGLGAAGKQLGQVARRLEEHLRHRL